MRYQGKITSWKDHQGFGFITPNGGDKQVFVHIKAFSHRQRRPVENEIVTYELSTDQKGRGRAENVMFVGNHTPITSSFGERSSDVLLQSSKIYKVELREYCCSDEFGYQKIREELEEELISKVKGASPVFFERLVVELLVSMGYGGSRKDAGQTLGKSGDGGIDGVIKEDRLGLDVIYLQAKRWEGNVGRPEIGV